MPKSISISNMAAKYLVDFLSHPAWMEKGPSDVFISGSILAEVLPRFEEAPKVDPEAATEENAVPLMYVPVLEAPVAPALTSEGTPDWGKMSREETADFRAKVADHNKKFMVWCRKPLPHAFEVTDVQLALIQRVLTFYSPRPEAEKQKDTEKQKQPRPELPANEFSLQLLRQFNLTTTL